MNKIIDRFDEHNMEKDEYNLYRDIQIRTEGMIYLGVVGPVRTGKSTFIKRFMDAMVLPYMSNEHEKNRTQDETPQSGIGKTITTTEPKFVPKEAAEITLDGGIHMKVRLVDCVGFMIPGANGALEGDSERLVKTPWSLEDIPFAKAAEIGTEKVIKEHSTIGIAIFTDGSFGDFRRDDYLEAEEKTVQKLKESGKPFVIILNSAKPYSEETTILCDRLRDKYQVSVIAINCAQMKDYDIHSILQEALYEFPVAQIDFYMPRWMEMLHSGHVMKQAFMKTIKEFMKTVSTMQNFMNTKFHWDCEYIEDMKVQEVSLSEGVIKIQITVYDKYYYEMLSEMMGQTIENEYHLMKLLKEFSVMKKEYKKVEEALAQVRLRGYGVVTPDTQDILLSDPEIIRHGNKFGVKIKAESPSIHMIRAMIETEIAPIVGSEDQAKDLVEYIQENRTQESGIWNTNIFGKTVEQLVQDGMLGKINRMGDECQLKLQDTMEKIVNDSNGKVICIII